MLAEQQEWPLNRNKIIQYKTSKNEPNNCHNCKYIYTLHVRYKHEPDI